MQNRRQSNRRRSEEWYECARCGFPYERSRVIVHNGLILCKGQGTTNCVDQPGYEAFRKHVTTAEKPIEPLPQIEEDL